MDFSSPSRRAFVRLAAALPVFPRALPPPRPAPARHKLAVVTTAYHYLSHAYHVCGRFLYGYMRDGAFHHPDWAIVGMYVAQHKADDLSGEVIARHGLLPASDVAGALTLGTGKLAVDGVLLIGEHGDYPFNDRGQKLYPRYELFQQIVDVFKKSGRSVPVFCDKHLSYDRRRAAEMVATARKIGFPLMAGSSLPITWRRPEVELPVGARVKEALVASRGELEIYGFHALEALQCMVERRAREESGVRAVTCLEGDAVWKAGDDGVWSWELLDHALGRSETRNVGDIRENCRQFAPPPGRPTFPRGPVAFVVEYRDGLRATALLLNGHVDDTTFAARVAGEAKLMSTLFYLPAPPGAAFLEALAGKIEDFMATGRPMAPVERTQLTGGILDVALESRARNHARLETPDLQIRYSAPAASGFVRGDYTSPA
jgi:hypothetical protein